MLIYHCVWSRDLNYEGVDAVNARLQAIKDTFASLEQLSTDRSTRIQVQCRQTAAAAAASTRKNTCSS